MDCSRAFGAGDLDQIGGHNLGEGPACWIARVNFHRVAF
jgi:hypothetical protein